MAGFALGFAKVGASPKRRKRARSFGVAGRPRTGSARSYNEGYSEGMTWATKRKSLGQPYVLIKAAEKACGGKMRATKACLRGFEEGASRIHPMTPAMRYFLYS